MTKVEIARKLKEARLKSHMTQAQVAQAIGKSANLVGHWETGYSQPDADTLSILLNLYKEDANSFFEIEKAPTAMRQEPVSMDATNSLLVSLGYIKPGEDLSDGDLAFLTHVIGLLDAWFGAKQK